MEPSALIVVFQPFYTAHHFNELSRGSVLCLLSASFEKRFNNATTWFFTPKSMTMASAGEIRGEWRHPVASRVGLDLRHHTAWSAWPSKWPAKQVNFFSVIDFVSSITVADWPCYGLLKIKPSYAIIQYYVFLVRILWCSADGNECRFGYHCRRWVRDFVIYREWVEIN